MPTDSLTQPQPSPLDTHNPDQVSVIKPFITQNSVLVPSDQMDQFEKKLAQLNKKATKFGLENVSVIDKVEDSFYRRYEYIGHDGDKLHVALVTGRAAQEEMRHLKRSGGESISFDTRPILLTRITLQYPIIKLADWAVIGKLEAVSGGNLSLAITRLPADEAATLAASKCPIVCEHCNTKRSRTDSYILRHTKTDDVKQVGSTCLEDFTGIDPSAVLFLAQMNKLFNASSELFDEFARSGKCNAISTQEYLKCVAFFIERDGFVSVSRAKESYEQPTFDQALQFLRNASYEPVLSKKYVEREPVLDTKIHTVREWIAATTEDTPYFHNLRLLLASDALDLGRKNLAFAASSITAYDRAMDQLKTTLNPDKPSNPQHVGALGDKITRELTITHVSAYPNSYGPGTLHYVFLKDDEGSSFKWRASACPESIYLDGKGKTLEATFKIKAHEQYKESPQNIITHLKIIRWIEQDQIESNEGHAPKAEFDPAIGDVLTDGMDFGAMVIPALDNNDEEQLALFSR